MINAKIANEIAMRNQQFDELIKKLENEIDTNIKVACAEGKMSCGVFYPITNQKENLIEELTKRLRENNYDLSTYMSISGFGFTILWDTICSL